MEEGQAAGSVDSHRGQSSDGKWGETTTTGTCKARHKTAEPLVQRGGRALTCLGGHLVV